MNDFHLCTLESAWSALGSYHYPKYRNCLSRRTCRLNRALDDIHVYDLWRSIYYIHTGIGSTRALFYVPFLKSMCLNYHLQFSLFMNCFLPPPHFVMKFRRERKGLFFMFYLLNIKKPYFNI